MADNYLILCIIFQLCLAALSILVFNLSIIKNFEHNIIRKFIRTSVLTHPQELDSNLVNVDLQNFLKKHHNSVKGVHLQYMQSYLQQNGSLGTNFVLFETILSFNQPYCIQNGRYFAINLEHTSLIVIDCQDSISNILVLYDIQNNQQQSFYYSNYKDVRLRKLLIAQSSRVLVLIQQDQFLLVCFRQNKYQICDQLTFQNNAHQAHIYENQITLISDYWIDVFEVVIINVYKIVYVQRKSFINIELEPNYPLLYYFHNPFNQDQYFVYQNQLKICIQHCVTIQLDGELRKIHVLKNYFIIQTSYSILIIYLTNGVYFKIKHLYNDDYLLMNKVLHEVLVLNQDQLKLYGLTQSPYMRIKNKRQLLLIDNSYYYYKNQIDDSGEDSIIFDERFKFKAFIDFPVNQNPFVAVGGALNITFNVEDSFKEKIQIKQSYFIHNLYSDVQYYFFGLDERQNQILITINKEQLIFYYDISILQKQTQTLIKNMTANLTDFIKVLSFKDAYYLKNYSSGQNFVLRLQMDNRINLIQFECLQNYKLAWCNSMLCVCQSKNEIYVKLLDRGPGIHIQKLEEEQILYLDYANDVKMVCLKNNNLLDIKYFNGTSFFQTITHIQTIRLCNNFINLVNFQFKLILVCSNEIILYNKLSNYRFIISGNVELYGEQFNQIPQVIQSNDHLYYIIDSQILYVFNSFLSLSQQYVTKIQIDKFDDVKVENDHICFSYENNLKCYYFSINIRFFYNKDKVEYHQAFKVNVCAENKYNKKCKQYITRLDQQNRGICVNKNIYSLVINENTKKIKLDNKFFSGSVDKIYINHLQLKPKLQVQAYIKIISDRAYKSYYNGFGNQIYILNNQTLTIYNIETRKIKLISTRKRMAFILKHKHNIILLGPYSITVINCEFDCKELQYLEEKIPLQGLLQIINNTLYSTGLGMLRTYNLDDLSQNKSVYQIGEQSGYYQIDLQQDKTGQICMVYLSYDGTLVFKYLDNTKKYSILEMLKQVGMHLDWSNPDAVYSAKILDDCRLVLLSTMAGYYFLELSHEITLRAQLVVQDPKSYRQGQILIGQSYLFYTQALQDAVAIYKFTYNQIYHSKFIDHCKKLYKPLSKYDQNEDYYYAYKDELYIVQQRYNEYIINKIDLDTEIRFDSQISSKQNILIELINSDENKSFIIELFVEEEDYNLIFFTVSGVLIIFYILLINFQMSKRAQ